MHHWRPGFRAVAAAFLALAAATACDKTEKSADRSPDRSTAPSPGAPAQSEADRNQPLAVIDGVVITVGEFQDRINRQSPYIRARYTSREQKKQFLDNLVRFEILAKEALGRGYDKDPDVIRSTKQVMIQKLMKEEFENQLKPESVTEDEMRAYYDANPDEYKKPEEMRVSAIILKNRKAAKSVATEALGEAGSTNRGFSELVTKYSTDQQTKLRGGDLRYFARDTTEIPKPVVEAAFSLTTPGQVAGPIDGGNGKHYIIKQTGHRKPIMKTYEQVKRQIQNRLYRSKRTRAQDNFVDGLRKGATITIHEENLKKVRINTARAESPSTDAVHGLPAFAGPDRTDGEPADQPLDDPALGISSQPVENNDDSSPTGEPSPR